MEARQEAVSEGQLVALIPQWSNPSRTHRRRKSSHSIWCRSKSCSL